MNLQVKEISYELNNDEGLSYLFFTTDNGYYSISRTEEDEDLHIELNDQSNGRYLDPDCFEYAVCNGEMKFSFNLNNNRILKHLAERDVDIEMYKSVVLAFEPVSVDKFNEMKSVVRKIFKTRRF